MSTKRPPDGAYLLFMLVLRSLSMAILGGGVMAPLGSGQRRILEVADDVVLRGSRHLPAPGREPLALLSHVGLA